MKTLLFLLIVQAFSNTFIAQSIVDSGLVAYYPFNSNVQDESGNGNHAIVYGAELTSDRFGNLNRAYAFNGIDNYIEAVNTTLPTNFNSRTISFWVKSIQDTIAAVINIGEIETIDTNTIFDIHYRHGSLTINTLTGSMGGWATNNDEWHHIAITYEDSVSVILYQDGNQNVMSWGPGHFFHTIGSSMRIGTCLSSLQIRSFYFGILDDIRIYNRSLSESEIDSLFNENPPTDVSESLGINLKSFNLYQNFPNPFNPTTKIEFSIPTENNVEIKVFNVLGVEVATLLNKRMEVGKHSVEFGANDLSSGIYFYKITTGNNSETKKMLLVR